MAQARINYGASDGQVRTASGGDGYLTTLTVSRIMRSPGS